MFAHPLRKALVVVAVAAAATLTAAPWILHYCGRSAPTHRVTFDVSDDGKQVYFTDWNGSARVFEMETGQVRDINLGSEPVSAIRISRNGDLLAVSTEPKDTRQHSEVIVAQKNFLGSWEERHRFRGMYPCFSSDEDCVYYCCSARSVVAGGFSGVLWSDATLWKYDLATQTETEISNQAYYALSDIEHDAMRSRLVYSGIPIDTDTSVRSVLFELDLNTSKIKQLSYCQKDCTCGSEPSLSEDGKILAYISDRDEPYRYKVILENLENQKAEVFGPKEINHYSTLPRLVGDECYVLNAESFTMTSQPRFRLLAFDRGGKWRVLMDQKLLSP